ncbi:MAG TPA: PorV/PorQ family protein [Bacteroidales bacterium]|nr:PorV/PorQ family protein [Bacteroidales bacterium]
MKRIYSSLFFFFLMCNIPGFGQSASFLGLWPDAATLAMGGTGTVATTGAFSLYNNTAATVLSDTKGALGASYTLWQTGRANHLAALSGFSMLGQKNAVSLGFRSYLHPVSELSTPEGNVTDTYKPLEFSVDLGYAYKIAENFSAGATLHYVRSQMGPEHAGNAFAADLGLLYKPGFLSIGLTAKNLGTKINYGYGAYHLPAHIELGTGAHMALGDKHAVHAVLQGGYLLATGGFTAGAGLEYLYGKVVAVRLGGHYGNPEKGIPSYVSAGLGFCLGGVSLQGTWLLGLHNSLLTNSFTIGLGWAF